jgi:hypothetical protein
MYRRFHQSQRLLSWEGDNCVPAKISSIFRIEDFAEEGLFTLEKIHAKYFP